MDADNIWRVDAGPSPARQPALPRRARPSAETPRPNPQSELPPRPPEPLPGIVNQETNLHCFGIR
ncbi:MAG: hypothetical protein A3F70_09190 [Acidobacteria bacterium RIFCSPLOWO2_12_FULL_67_14]|nr:MAG: hypothetical protein A3H29_02945 [Acidobacteria bacterium RIFCSPLOWO2_02_FULL_67_21]OFW40669.1 MAG: hypothetical protein A3F70_09190 [Acidobacteria bacterium RIFCSPLOWO2_12_FULL_67_14]